MGSLIALVLAAAPVVVTPFVGSSPEFGIAAQSLLVHDLRANGLEVRTVDTQDPERLEKLKGSKVVVAGALLLVKTVRAVIVVNVLDLQKRGLPALQSKRVKRWDDRAPLVTAVFHALKLTPPQPLTLEPADDALLDAWGVVLSALARGEPTANRQLDDFLVKWPRFSPAVARRQQRP